MYSGDNPDCGFHVYFASNNLIFKVYCNGQIVDSSQTVINMMTNNANSRLYYKKTSNGVVFGASADGIPTITACVSTAKKTDGTSLIGYVSFLYSTSEGLMRVYLEDGSIDAAAYVLPTNTSLYTNNLISAAPLCCVAGNSVFDHVYLPSVFMSTIVSQNIIVGNKEYISSSKRQANSAGFLFEI